MTAPKLVALLVILASLLAAPTAGASEDVTVADLQNIRPTGDTQITDEVGKAIDFWRQRGVTACPAGVHAWTADFPGFQIAGGANCNIYLDSYSIGARRAASARGIYDMAGDNADECALVFHETGHAMGLQHTATGVMAPTAGVPWDCRAFARELERAQASRDQQRRGHSRHDPNTRPIARTAGPLRS